MFLLQGLSETEASLFNDISQVAGSIFHGVDLVTSDIAAAMIVMSRRETERYKKCICSFLFVSIDLCWVLMHLLSIDGPRLVKVYSSGERRTIRGLILASIPHCGLWYDCYGILPWSSNLSDSRFVSI